ncbi:hypothetical protein HMPREF1550_01378 [Actinomyces sp. oral taxon 877 str. F0543]|nr:hypothetical protein HMPREF1550_01378 [Actinomyces sp. oral taxon 877 str. F0543]
MEQAHPLRNTVVSPADVEAAPVEHGQSPRGRGHRRAGAPMGPRPRGPPARRAGSGQ